MATLRSPPQFLAPSVDGVERRPRSPQPPGGARPCTHAAYAVNVQTRALTDAQGRAAGAVAGFRGRVGSAGLPPGAPRGHAWVQMWPLSSVWLSRPSSSVVVCLETSLLRGRGRLPPQHHTPHLCAFSDPWSRERAHHPHSADETQPGVKALSRSRSTCRKRGGPSSFSGAVRPRVSLGVSARVCIGAGRTSFTKAALREVFPAARPSRVFLIHVLSAIKRVHCWLQGP